MSVEMTRMEEIQSLIATVNEATARITLLQYQCQHRRVRHRMFKDGYMGQGASSECVDCGKSLGCSTSPPWPRNEVIEKDEIVEAP